MINSAAHFRASPGIARSMCGILGTLLCVATYAGEPKKQEPAHPAAPAPAAHAAAPPAGHPGAGAAPGAAPAAGAAPHGPTTSSPHGPTTSAPNGPTTTSHGPTTAAPHGPTTSAPHGPTTGERAAPASVTRGAPGGEKAGGSVGRAGTPAAGKSSFAGRPAPTGSHEVRAANGAAVRTRADGSRSDVHDPARGMDIHHGLNGGRHVEVERPDHSRIVAERSGAGYVQHPYSYGGHEFEHRTYYDNGRAYDHFYGRYPYGGGYLAVYAPAAYYPYGFYGYAYSPWPAPVPYAWAPAPWYGTYGYFYAPYAVYAAPSFWLADFVIAASLAVAFEAVAAGAQLEPEPQAAPGLLAMSRWLTDQLVGSAEAAANSTPALTPEIKNQVADEVKLLVQQEGDEAKTNAAKGNQDPTSSSIIALLSDHHPHVFVAGDDLDLVNGSGSECAVSRGDVLRVAAAPAEGADSVNATVLASKGNKECASASTVTVAIKDLQDMHNHLRESIDNGLSELQKKQGKDGLPAAPAAATGEPVKAAFAAGAPPPDANAGKDIAQQAKEADAAETSVAKTVAAEPAAGAGPSTTIAVGQSIEAVTAALGAPTRIIDLGAKKIYNYPDMKIIFLNGKVSDVE